MNIRTGLECIDFETPGQLPAVKSFATPIGEGLEFRLTADDAGVWRISVGPSGTRRDYLWLASPPFRTAPHLQIGPGYGLTGVQSAQKSPRAFRFVTTPQEYDTTVELVNIALRDASGGLTAAAIAQRGKGTLELWITGFEARGSEDALAWINVRGRACQPMRDE